MLMLSSVPFPLLPPPPLPPPPVLGSSVSGCRLDFLAIVPLLYADDLFRSPIIQGSDGIISYATDAAYALHSLQLPFQPVLYRITNPKQ